MVLVCGAVCLSLKPSTENGNFCTSLGSGISLAENGPIHFVSFNMRLVWLIFRVFGSDIRVVAAGAVDLLYFTFLFMVLF